LRPEVRAGSRPLGINYLQGRFVHGFVEPEFNIVNAVVEGGRVLVRDPAEVE